MAEHGPPQNGHLEIKLGSKSIGLTSRDLVSVLLILLSGLGGYFVSTMLIHNQTEGLRMLQAQALQISSQQAALVDLVHTNRQQLESEIRGQNTLMLAQTVVLATKVEEQTQRLDAKFERVYRYLSIINDNNWKNGPGRGPLEGADPRP